MRLSCVINSSKALSLGYSPEQPAFEGTPMSRPGCGRPASLDSKGKRPGGRGKQGLRRLRCRISAPSGLLMGLAEPPCLCRQTCLREMASAPAGASRPPWPSLPGEQRRPSTTEPCGTGPDTERVPTGGDGENWASADAPGLGLRGRGSPSGLQAPARGLACNQSWWVTMEVPSSC